MILLNQTAQGVRPLAELIQWFEMQHRDHQRRILSELCDMIQHSRPRQDDGVQAIKNSGLKPTFTPCILLSRGTDIVRLRKVASLPEAERTKAMILLLNLFRISDNRRQSQEGADEPELHWWHEDLSDPKVLADIRRRYEQGRL